MRRRTPDQYVHALNCTWRTTPRDQRVLGEDGVPRIITRDPVTDETTLAPCSCWKPLRAAGRRQRAKRARVTPVSMAEVIALSRTTRIIREHGDHGAIIGVERIEAASGDVTPSDVLGADRFLTWYERRPMK